MMQFNGYSFQTLLPALAGIAVIVAVLYLIRVRRRTVHVPYIGLWQQVLEQSSHRTWHEWLRRFLSFLICMIIMGLIALALMDPREEESTDARRHAVIIIDTSASMAAAGTEKDGCKTRFECAVRDARDLIDHMKPTDRVVIVEASGIVSAVSGPFQADKSALQRAVSSLKPRATSADMKSAVELAAHLTDGRKNAEIFLLTDGQFQDAESISSILPGYAAFEQRTYGAPTGNLSIEAFNVRRYIANRLGFEVFFKAHNGFDVPVDARLRIVAVPDSESQFNPSAPHEIISEKMITLASGSSELRLYENLTLSSSRMAATIELVDPAELDDPMPMDNIAYARIPDYAKPDIACITPGNLYLEAALLLNENYHVSFIRPDSPDILNDSSEIDLASVAAAHDIVILDNSYRNLPHLAASDWNGRAIFINPDAGDAPLKSQSVNAPLIERVNAKHPVARWLSLKNLNIARANVFSGVPNSDLVMRAIEGPLMATHKTDKQRYLAIGFSLVESDLIFRVGLPVLFINAVDWLMDENAQPLRGFPTGKSWHVALPGASSRVEVALPDGKKLSGLPVYDGSVSIYGESAGFYNVKNTDGGNWNYEFAANFLSRSESDLSANPAQLQGRVHLKTTLGDDVFEEEESWILNLLSNLPESSQYIWVLALLIAMGLLSVEWLTYHRRWTV